MKYWLLLILAILLTACASTASPGLNPTRNPGGSNTLDQGSNPQEETGSSNYPDLGPAPELVGDIWLNTESSLRLADLRGKVVLVDMWTFG